MSLLLLDFPSMRKLTSIIIIIIHFILQLVSDAYAHDIENALLLSKIDFEEHKATMKIINEERARLALLEAAAKPKTMSLEQFHKLDTQSSIEASTTSASIQEETKENSKNKHSKHEKAFDSAKTSTQRTNEDITNGHGDNEEFFQKLQQETLNTINREQLLHSTRNMSVVSKFLWLFINMRSRI